VAPIAQADDGAIRNVNHRSNGTSRAGLESTPADRHRRLTRSPPHGAAGHSNPENRSQDTKRLALPNSPPAETGNVHNAPAAVSDLKPSAITANVATMKPEALREFAAQPTKVQQLIRDALSLTEQNLTYKYGSSDPSTGGMDCSGFIYHVLKHAGYNDVPRQSSDQYVWLRQKNEFFAVLSRSPGSFEFKDLKPGDLLFWSGTYKVDREIPITHVMIYLGTEKLTDKPVMVGASDGRSYAGVQRSGVSVFDFKMPSQSSRSDPDLVAKFVGYGKIPGLRDLQLLETQTNFHEPTTKSTAKPRTRP
jgi:cell wall-associated NlpC family hydrolase